MSVVFSFVRLIWLNYKYCKIFGCAPKCDMLSSCCVWANSLLAYLALVAMLYFFFGRYVPEIVSFTGRQARLSQGPRKFNIVLVTKAITFEIQDAYHFTDRIELRRRKVNETLFHGIFSNTLKLTRSEGILLKQDKRCSDIFYHVKPQIIMNHVWNPEKGKFDNSTTEFYWQWKGKSCSAVKDNSGTVVMTSCLPLWFEIKPVWCNFTFRIVYDQKKFVTFYNVANVTEETCAPVHKNWITAVQKDDGTEAKQWSYCEKAARKWKPVWHPDIVVCYFRS